MDAQSCSCTRCGAPLRVFSENDLARCPACGAKLYRFSDCRQYRQRFEQGMSLRQSGNFEEAAACYTGIIYADPQIAEAYWCRLLCKYGVQYVADESGVFRKPRISRLSHVCVLKHRDYAVELKTVLEKADPRIQESYCREAEGLERLRRSLIKSADAYGNYDIILCCRMRDDETRTTRDDALARQLYERWTQQGRSVFYEGISLDRSDSELYMVQLNAALVGAKVMVLLASDPGDLRVDWVQREWTKFLKDAVGRDFRRVLIPCLQNISWAQLPPELQNLEAENRSSSEFLTSLDLRLLEILGVPADNGRGGAFGSLGNEKEKLLDLGFFQLEAGKWQDAHERFARALDLDPECARAYLGEMMAELKVHSQDELMTVDKDPSSSGYYPLALRFADSQLAERLTYYTEQYREAAGWRQHEAKYQELLKMIDNAASLDDYEQIREGLQEIRDYKDADILLSDCEACIEELKQQQIRYARIEEMHQMQPPMMMLCSMICLILTAIGADFLTALGAVALLTVPVLIINSIVFYRFRHSEGNSVYAAVLAMVLITGVILLNLEMSMQELVKNSTDGLWAALGLLVMVPWHIHGLVLSNKIMRFGNSL